MRSRGDLSTSSGPVGPRVIAACGLQREAEIIEKSGATAIAGGGDAVRLEAMLEAEVARGGVAAVLSSGLCGALDPELRPGEVVVGEIVRPSTALGMMEIDGASVPA
ncbi:MAG: hypothetical protein AAGD40_04640, partial [Pseudomonadota bacterium]